MCPHCEQGGRFRRIPGVPLPELSDEHLAHFAFKAMTTWGSVEDYKHFLPRILEHACNGAPWPGYSWPTITRKLRYAHWEEWTNDERGALQALARALWEPTLARAPDCAVHTPSDVLELIYSLRGEVDAELDAWGRSTELKAAIHLADLLLGTSTFDDANLRARVATWLRDSARARQLEYSFERGYETPYADRLAFAIDFYDATRV